MFIETVVPNVPILKGLYVKMHDTYNPFRIGKDGRQSL